MAEVRLNNLSKSFGSINAVSNLNLTVMDGSFVVFLGPTGAGKTTLLRLIAGLETPDNGQVFIDGKDVIRLTPSERNVAMVFQQYSLYPHLTVQQNLEFPLRSPLSRMEEYSIKQAVEEVSKKLHIDHKINNKTTELSGGEMQRVAIGRALVRSPNVFLMDEPLSSLDAKLRSELRVELKRIQEEMNRTFLYVTHDQIEAMTMATHIGVLENGGIAQFGLPREVYDNPNSIYVAARLGQPRINVLPASLFDESPTSAQFIGMRPEQIVQGSGVDTRVKRIERLGDQTRLHLSLEGHDLVTTTETHTKMLVGDIVKIQPKNPFFFDASGARLRTK